MYWTSSSGPNLSYSYSSVTDAVSLAPSTDRTHLPSSSLITFVKRIFIPTEPDQAYYWTPLWQARETEADQDIRLGRYEVFETMDDFIASLDDPLLEE
jgi:hypothetical protein